MLNTLKTAALSAMIGLTALAGIPAAAQAEGLYLNFGGHGQSRAGVYFGDDDGYVVRRHRRDRDEDRYGDRDRGRRHNGCSPERALNKAERMGIHRARIVDVSRHTITVRGRQYGDRVTLTFARAPGCPTAEY